MISRLPETSTHVVLAQPQEFRLQTWIRIKRRRRIDDSVRNEGRLQADVRLADGTGVKMGGPNSGVDERDIPQVQQ